MIKIIALITMLLDHIGQVFLPNVRLLALVGRLAFPLFAWGIANGYKRTNNLKKYIFRLLSLAILSQVPHYILFKTFYLNVCFTLLAGLLVLKLYESEIYYLIKWLVILCIIMFSHIMNFEYGIYGIATIVIFHIFDGKYYLVLLQGIATILGIIFYRYYSFQIISVLSTIIVILGRKYDFKINRKIQYGFYPVHILFLIMLTYIFPNA